MTNSPILRPGDRLQDKPPVAIYLDHLQGGGMQKIFLQIASTLAERGYQVYLLLCKARGPLRNSLASEVNLVELSPSPALTAYRQALAADPAGFMRLIPILLSRDSSPTLSYLPSLAAFLQREKPHALLAATPFMNVEAVMAQQLVGTKTRLIVSEHNDLSSGHPYGRGWRGRFLAVLLRHAYRSVNAVVAVSEGVASDVRRRTGLPAARIVVVYNPIVSPDLVKKAQTRIDHPWLQTAVPPVILGAGRLGRAKDFPTLLRAFARIRQRRPARLIILGEAANAKKTDAQRAKLMALARELGVAEAVDFPGFVQNPYAYMSRAAVFALSSLYEGFGNVLAEAMACGCPVVSTNCRSGPAEILDHGRYGPLVAVGDDTALAGAIETLLDRPPERRLLQQRGFEFSVDRAVDSYEKLLVDGLAAV